MRFHGGFILFELLNQRVSPGIRRHCPRLPTQKCASCCANQDLKDALVPLPSRPSRFQGWAQPRNWEGILQTTLSTPDEQQGPLTPRCEFKSGPVDDWVIRAIKPIPAGFSTLLSLCLLPYQVGILLLSPRCFTILLYGSITQCWGQREAPKQRSTFYKPPKHHTTKPKTWDINHQRKKSQTCQNTCIWVRVTSAGFHGNRVSLLQTSAVFGNSVHGPEAHLLDHSGGDKSYKDGFDFGEPPNAVQQEIKWKHSWLFVRNMAVFIKHRH